MVARNRPPAAGGSGRIGEIAVERGLINSSELKKALKGQGFFHQAGRSLRLGELLVSQKFISREQLADLLEDQARLRSTK
jgi:hypothetical protein